MQFIDPAHDREIGRGDRPSFVIEAAPAQLQERSLPAERKFVPAVDHRFALSRPALLGAPAKKSFSSVSSPIFA